MSKALLISVSLLLTSFYGYWAYCEDSIGVSALEALVKRAEREYGSKAESSLNLKVISGVVQNKDVYDFSSGFEIPAGDGNIIIYSVQTYNQHLFHQNIPEMRKLSTEALLANFPILPELQPVVVDIIRVSKNRVVKIALTIALRNTVILSAETVKFLSDQIRVRDEELLSATLLALTPRINDARFAFLSNFDLKPVIDALHELSIHKVSSSSALLIEAMLSRVPYLLYFAIEGQGAAELLRKTAKVRSRGALEESARKYFRKEIQAR
jgi:hypothetical protein